jgi:hypothetical protein
MTSVAVNEYAMAVANRNAGEASRKPVAKLEVSPF